MGGLFSALPHDDEERSLSQLLEEDDPVPWDFVRARLAQFPEEAALFCHSVEPSPLAIALSKGNVPVQVFDSFVDAYEDALYSLDRHRRHVLHEAVCNSPDCSQIVQRILRLAPDAATHVAKDGTLALHQKLCDEKAALILLNAHAFGVGQRDKLGNLPLHYAVDAKNINPEVVKMLIESAKLMGLGRGGGVGARSKTGISPLKILCKRFAENVQKIPAGERLSPENEMLWDLIVLFIRSVKGSHSLLHSAIEMGCPQEVVSQAVRSCPGQTRKRDVQGRTPLTLAASISCPDIISELAQADGVAGRMADNEGRLPIDIAAEHGKAHEAVHALVKAEPRAVDTRDLRDKMFPFMTAAVGDNANVDTIYELLRAKPHVLKHFRATMTDSERESANDPEDVPVNPLCDKEEAKISPNEPPHPMVRSDIRNRNIGGHSAFPIPDSEDALTDGSQQDSLVAAAAEIEIEVE